MTDSVLRVLTYHRVIDPASQPPPNPSLVSATPRVFERQIALLSKKYRVVSMTEVLDAQAGKRALPKRAVVITFDDAYRDFAEVAWPVLRRYGFGATVFVPTAYPGDRQRVFWWDRLHDAVSRASRERIDVPALGSLPLSTAVDRRASLRRLQRMVKTMPHVEAMRLVDQLCECLGNPETGVGNVLSWDELRELAKDGVTLAAHTRTHPALTQLSPEEARAEIRGSRNDLQRELGEVLPVFAFPFGAQNDQVVALAREEGFQLAFSCLDGHNSLPSSDPLRLRRTNITPRTSPAIFRLRLLRLTTHIDRWRHQLRQRER